MATTAAQNIDTWVRAPYTTEDYLSTGVQQHPGNGVVTVTGAAQKVIRHSVAKTQKSYNVDGVMAIAGSQVESQTWQMRQAYPGVDMDVDQLPGGG